jgi:hypothetical protein
VDWAAEASTFLVSRVVRATGELDVAGLAPLDLPYERLKIRRTFRFQIDGGRRIEVARIDSKT